MLETIHEEVSAQKEWRRHSSDGATALVTVAAQRAGAVLLHMVSLFARGLGLPGDSSVVGTILEYVDVGASGSTASVSRVWRSRWCLWLSPTSTSYAPSTEPRTPKERLRQVGDTFVDAFSTKNDTGEHGEAKQFHSAILAGFGEGGDQRHCGVVPAVSAYRHDQ